MKCFSKCNECGHNNAWELPTNGEVSHLICQTCGANLGYEMHEIHEQTIIPNRDGEILFNQLWEFASDITKNSWTPYQEVASKIGKLVSEKQKMYGDSFGKCSQILEVLYPDGIPVEQYTDALAIVRVIDKLFRISCGNQGDEDAWSDICGYSILSVVKNKQRDSNED